MSAHTPGPWSVDPRASLRVLARGDTTICSTGCADTERGRWEANARLIAAAPELLEALEMVRDYIRTMKGAGHEYTEAVEAAIAKATQP